MLFTFLSFLSTLRQSLSKTRGTISFTGVIILNFARDLLVDDDAIEAALKSGKVRKYVTDFPNARTAGMEGVIAIPHLGASTEEAEDNCAAMAAKELVDYLENGNIRIVCINFIVQFNLKDCLT